jgi:hypothetical protein
MRTNGKNNDAGLTFSPAFIFFIIMKNGFEKFAETLNFTVHHILDCL